MLHLSSFSSSPFFKPNQWPTMSIKEKISWKRKWVVLQDQNICILGFGIYEIFSWKICLFFYNDAMASLKAWNSMILILSQILLTEYRREKQMTVMPSWRRLQIASWVSYYISLLSGLENIDDQNRTPNSNNCDAQLATPPDCFTFILAIYYIFIGWKIEGCHIIL